MENKQMKQFQVRNAGLVILQSYFAPLFEKLRLVTDHTFHNDDAREAATHYLHYLVTGHENSEDPDLLLNKLLCGIKVSQPIEYGITISDEKKRLIESLIESVINHWPAIGNCSVNGFRGNWLVRRGLLTEQEDRWELKVEHHGYDVLLHQSPFSFSVIHFTWMQKPLYVTWNA
jgi:hypothetical protein